MIEGAMAAELINTPEVTSPARPNRGPFASEDQALGEVVSRLVRALDPREIWLFGSRAEGRNAPDSDFDLLVVTKVEDGQAGFDFDAVYAPLKGLGVGCDVVPCRADEFDEERGDPTSLCWLVTHIGKKLYDRAEPDSGLLHPR
jgi:predicted nucleotidyltransferase